MHKKVVNIFMPALICNVNHCGQARSEVGVRVRVRVRVGAGAGAGFALASCWGVASLRCRCRY